MPPRTTVTRYLPAAALLWAAVISPPTPAAANYISLYDASGQGTITSVTFLSSGLLFGMLAVDTAELHSDTGALLRTVAIANGALTFGLGVPDASTNGRFTYRPGGDLQLTGRLAGGPSEVIISSPRLFNAASGPDTNEPGTYWLAQPATFMPAVAADFVALFGTPASTASLGLAGFGLPGSVVAGPGAHGGIRVDVAGPGAVPEPGSGVLVGLGCGVAAGLMGYRRSRMRKYPR